MRTHMTPLTHCKTVNCREPITVHEVISEQQVSESPQHIVVIYKCALCGRTDKMVGTHESWDEFTSEAKEVDNDLEVAMTAASIEVDGIESAHDLEVLWRSYKRPPILEDRIGMCDCPTCRKRDYFGTR